MRFEINDDKYSLFLGFQEFEVTVDQSPVRNGLFAILNNFSLLKETRFVTS